MKFNDIQVALRNCGVPDDLYSLTGGLPNEALCLEQLSDSKWRTYYSERGQRSGEKHFHSEEEACDFFFQTLVKEFGVGGLQ